MRLFVYFLLGTAALGLPAEARAQAADDEARHTVTAAAERYVSIEVAPTPSFVAKPGASKSVVSTYALVTNVPARQRMVASVEGRPPPGVSLWVDVEPPDGAEATGKGAVRLLGPGGRARSQTTVVAGIGQVSEAGLTITYTTEVTADVLADVDIQTGDQQVRLGFELVE